jgi:6,7-dimethyl-8-ribityllumazine synthase
MESTAVVTNGILTVDTLDQALERAGSKAGNKGADVALAAIETVNVLRRLS